MEWVAPWASLVTGLERRHHLCTMYATAARGGPWRAAGRGPGWPCRICVCGMYHVLGRGARPEARRRPG